MHTLSIVSGIDWTLHCGCTHNLPLLELVLVYVHVHVSGEAV